MHPHLGEFADHSTFSLVYTAANASMISSSKLPPSVSPNNDEVLSNNKHTGFMASPSHAVLKGDPGHLIGL